jgi:hypothetical protein
LPKIGGRVLRDPGERVLVAVQVVEDLLQAGRNEELVETILLCVSGP